MPQSVESQIADLKKSVKKRKETDHLLNFFGIGACITVLAPWLLGRFVLRDTFFRVNQGVYDEGVRQDGAYFLTDWLMGCAAILSVIAILLILRPWSARIGAVVWGFILLAGASFFLIPTSAQAWGDAELNSKVELATTAYPFSDKWYTCGSESIRIENTLWQVHEAQRAGSQTRGCDRLEVYAGWQSHGLVDLAPGESVSRVEISPDGTVTVTTQSGNNGLRFPLGEPTKRL